MSFERCPFATCACPFSRCGCAPELCLRQEKPSQETPPLKEGRRSADKRIHQEPHRKEMQRAPFLLPPFYGGTEAQDFIESWTSWSGRARLSAPHRGTRRGFGLGSARAALPGTTGCKREDPLRHQCSEHLAVRHAPDGTIPKPPASAVYRCTRENRSRSASGSTLAKGVLRERDDGYVTVMGTRVKSIVTLLGTNSGRNYCALKLH